MLKLQCVYSSEDQTPCLKFFFNQMKSIFKVRTLMRSSIKRYQSRCPEASYRQALSEKLIPELNGGLRITESGLASIFKTMLTMKSAQETSVPISLFEKMAHLAFSPDIYLLCDKTVFCVRITLSGILSRSQKWQAKGDFCSLF